LLAIRATRALTVAITNESWGKTMSHGMRHAFAEYMRRFHLDISEVDNLGGKPYRNGNYYKRRIAQMRTRGLVEWTEGDYISIDARLDALVAAGDEWALGENVRRARERIRWAVPADATHAYVARVKLKQDGKPLEGCDWITPARVKKVKDWGDDRKFKGWKEVPADPVGAEEPEKTVITRAWRRAGLLAAAEIPELKQEEEIMDVEAEAVEATVSEIREREDARDERSEIKPAMLTVAPINDPYSLGPGAPVTAVQTKNEPQPVRLTDQELDDMRFPDDL
ncbi:MAG TPA: hypothetical protein VIK52_06755, partial [Opitutaceae bacterium]